MSDCVLCGYAENYNHHRWPDVKGYHSFKPPEWDARSSLIEKIAPLEHDQWMKWAVAVSGEVSDERRERWVTFLVPYDQLDETAKNQDRVYAARIVDAVVSWLAEHAEVSFYGSGLDLADLLEGGD